MMQNKTILLISPEAWGTNFVSKHHYANYLAKNNSVYFLNPPTTYTKNPFGTVSCKTRVVKHGLVIVNYINLLPRLNTLPGVLRKKTYARQAKQIQEKLGIEKFDIVWSFDPNRFYDQHAWKADKRIYHTVDVHSDESFERAIAESSDIVFYVSKYLLKKVGFVKNKHLIIHGVHLVNMVSPSKLVGQNKVKIGLMGNFQSGNLDYISLKKIAESTKSLADIILLGPIGSNNLNPNKIDRIDCHIDVLKNLENVYFLGEKSAEQLDSYLINFDINLILYQDFTKNIFPHKIMKYFANGNLVLSSEIFDKDEFPADSLTTIIEEHITNQIIKIIDNLPFYNSPELKAKRRAFAEANSYDLKIEEISKLIYH